MKNINKIKIIDFFETALFSTMYLIIITILLYLMVDKDPYGEGIGFGIDFFTFILINGAMFTIILCTILIFDKINKIKRKNIVLPILKSTIFTAMIVLPTAYIVNRYNKYYENNYALSKMIEGESIPNISLNNVTLIFTIFIIFFCARLILLKLKYAEDIIKTND